MGKPYSESLVSVTRKVKTPLKPAIGHDKKAAEETRRSM
jgi:hypothetical protein